MFVGPSVGTSPVFFAQLFRRFLSITAPAQPHATDGRVSGLVLYLPNYNISLLFICGGGRNSRPTKDFLDSTFHDYAAKYDGSLVGDYAARWNQYN